MYVHMNVYTSTWKIYKRRSYISGHTIELNCSIFRANVYHNSAVYINPITHFVNTYFITDAYTIYDSVSSPISNLSTSTPVWHVWRARARSHACWAGTTHNNCHTWAIRCVCVCVCVVCLVFGRRRSMRSVASNRIIDGHLSNFCTTNARCVVGAPYAIHTGFGFNVLLSA